MTEISLEYFNFQTTTKVTFQIDAKFNDPANVFCTRYTDIIDRRNHKKYGIFNESKSNIVDILKDTSKLKISDIFELTPHATDAMIGCYLREHDYDLVAYSLDECYSLFEVTKYQEGGFICYQFQTKIVDSKFNCDQIAFAYASLNDMYIILLHSRFKLSNVVKTISFVPSRHKNPIFNLPTTSRRFYSMVARYAGNLSQSSKSNYLRISGDMYSITRLEKPYDTNCVKNEVISDFACYRRCNIAIYKKHGLFPSNEFTTRALPMKHMNPEAISNKTVLQDIKVKSDTCREKCNQKSCHESYSMTSTTAYPYLKNNSVSIASSCSQRPVTVIQFLPRITFMEFILYISSSLGIWFGISIFSINPFKKSRLKVISITKQTRNENAEYNECRELTVSELRVLYNELNRRVNQIENR